VNITAFNIMDVMFFKPLAVRDPLSLVHLRAEAPTRSSTDVAYPEVAFYRDHNTIFSAVLAQTATHMTMGEEATEDVRVGVVSGNYFTDLGAGAAYGRVLTAEDEKPDASPAVLLGYGFWQRRFGSDPSAVGCTIRFNQHPATVVGVLPYDFSGLNPEHGVTNEAWLVISKLRYFVPETKMLTSFDLEESHVQMSARLKPGFRLKTVEAALAPLAREFEQQHPAEVPKGERLIVSQGGYAVTLDPGDKGVVPVFAMFATLVLLILAATCGNLGNVLLGRAAARDREISIRLALGATRGRIVRQLMTESLLLALLGSAAGLFLSWVTSRPLVQWLGGASNLDLRPDWRTTLVSFALGAIACVLFGLPAARHAARQAHTMSRTRTIFMATQIITSCVLLVVAGLLVRGLHRILTTDLGYDYKHAVVIDPQLYAHAYTQVKAVGYMRDLQARVARAPGVESSALATVVPLGNRIWGGGQFESDSGAKVHVYLNAVSPNYFKTLAIPILRGRDFNENETGVVIVSESFARKMWSGKDPLQQTFTWQKKKLPVVGLSGNARTVALRDREGVELYFAAVDSDLTSAAMLVRTSRSPDAMSSLLRGLVRPLDPVLSPNVYALHFAFDDRISDTKKMASVVSGMGGLALLLALVGLYGVVSYTVTQRTKEIGIRMALGASRSKIVQTIASRFLLPVSLALIAGVGVAALLSIILRSQLFGMSNFDPLSYAAAIVALIATGILASALPARRALRVDPVEALRCD